MHVRDSSALSSEELVEGIRLGDEVLEAELFSRFQSGLIRMLEQRTRDRARAEDLAQDTLLTVIVRLRNVGIDHPKRLTGFIYQTAKYIHLGWVRKISSKVENNNGLHQEPLASQNLEDEKILDEEIQITRNTINDMKIERDREILFRYYVSDEPKHYICEMLDLSSENFDRVLHRARSRFRKLLSERNLDGVNGI